MHENHGVAASLLTSMVTAVVVSIPEPVVSYAGKLASVFVLAMVAEGGRRLVSWLVSKMRRKS